jgi:parallel beta-helix repeat protein
VTETNYLIDSTEQGNPTIRNNRINKNGYEAIWIYQGGRGIIEDNDLTGNKHGPWSIENDCLPNVKRSGNKE